FLSGDWPLMLRVFVFAVVGIYALSAALQGCMERPFGLFFRVLCIVAGLLALWPAGVLVNVVGALFVVVLLFWNVRFAGDGVRAAA
ncbi:TRAP transporter permease, partial [Yoonia sp. 208BN28-4]